MTRRLPAREQRADLALVIGLAVFPLVKIHVVDQLRSVERFRTTGDRTGWWVEWILYLGLELAVVGLCWWAMAPPDRAARLSFGSPRPRRWAMVVLLVAGVTLLLVLLRHTGTLDLTAHHPATDHLPTSAASTSQRLLLLGAAVVAVLCEEAIFRGFAISHLVERGVRRGWAVAIPAIGFGYLHGGVTSVAGAVQTVLVAGAAVGLGYLYLRASSLLPSAVLHLSWTWMFIALTPT